ncbi:MAG: AI-2E family transporter [Deltaproteobacteria bacterium]|jgi:predicted PurR-regulated permease PerM|nr:AI-2E family transporter [Deltaproteobacteria bacterium]
MAFRPGHRVKGNRSGQALRPFVALGLFFMAAFILTNLKIVILPMVLAFFISCLLNPLVAFFQRRGFPRLFSVVLTLILGLMVIWVAVNFFLESLYSFQNGLPAYKARFDGLVSDMVAFKNRRFDFVTLDMFKEQLQKISFGGIVGGVLNSFVTFAGYFSLTLLFTLYFLPALPAFPEKLKKAFPGRKGLRLSAALAEVSDKVQSYILVKSLVSLGLGICFGAVCLLFKVDFAASWGIIAFLLNFIPTVGVIVSLLLPTLLCALQHGWASSLWLALCLGAPAALVLNWVEPHLLGRSVDLSPTAALMAILFWGVLWGGVGMIIAVPATAVIKLTCDSFDGLRPVGTLMGN